MKVVRYGCQDANRETSAASQKGYKSDELGENSQ